MKKSHIVSNINDFIRNEGMSSQEVITSLELLGLGSRKIKNIMECDYMFTTNLTNKLSTDELHRLSDIICNYEWEEQTQSFIEEQPKSEIRREAEFVLSLPNVNVIINSIGIEKFIDSEFVEHYVIESNRMKLVDFVYQLVLAYNEISPITTPIAKKVVVKKEKKLTKQEMYHNAHLMFTNIQFATWVYNQLNDSRFGLDVEYRHNIINENEFWERKGAQDLLSNDATLLFSHIDTTLRHEHLNERYIGLRSAYRKIITFFNSNFKPFENDLQPYIDRYEYNTGKKITIAGGQN